MTLGLIKSMSNNAYVNNGENDCTGLYHSSLLAEDRLQDFTRNHLEDLINTMVNNLVKDIDDFYKQESRFL